MLTLGLAGTAATTYRVLPRHLVQSRLAAAIAALLAGFAPGTIHHANGQPNFTAHFLAPFLVLIAARMGRSRDVVRDGAILGLLATWQVFINEEMLVGTAGAIVLAVVTYALMSRGETVRRTVRRPRAARVAGVSGVRDRRHAPSRYTTELVGRLAGTGQVPPVTEDMRRRVRADLTHWKAGLVALGRAPHGDQLLRLLEAVLGPGTRADDVWIRRVSG